MQFFILSTDWPFETFPKHNGVATISECFALNLTNNHQQINNYLLHYDSSSNKISYCSL